MLRWRLLSAGIILAVLLSLMWLDARQAVFGVAGAWLLPVFVAITIMATEEVLWLLANKGHRPVAWIVHVGSVAIAMAACLPLFLAFRGETYSHPLLGRIGWPFCVFGLAIAAAFAGEMQRFKRPGSSIVNVSLSIATLAYTGVLMSFLAALRLLDEGSLGLAALVSVIFIVKLSDSGAYMVGRTVSRLTTTHKMTPLLSPGKTWEGAVGGVTSAVIGSWIFFQYIGPAMLGSEFTMPATWAWVVYGLVLAAFGMLGDLAESLLKRDMERKDSSTWLPGLGGVLDIIDSLLMAAPPAYLCWASGMLGPVT